MVALMSKCFFQIKKEDRKMPLALKEKGVGLLLKQSSLDPAILDKYYPVSHLPFIGKVSEKMVTFQLQKLLGEFYLGPFQLILRFRHGRVTAFVALVEDFHFGLNGESVLPLALLDLLISCWGSLVLFLQWSCSYIVGLVQ